MPQLPHGCVAWLDREGSNSKAPFDLHVNPVVPLLSNDLFRNRGKLRSTNHSCSCLLRPWIRVRRDNLEAFYAALPVEPECNFH